MKNINKRRKEEGDGMIKERSKEENRKGVQKIN